MDSERTTRILLVDDDPLIAELLAKALRREGLAVQVVHSGVAALEAAGDAPHLISLDLKRPETDGLDVCRQLRRAGHRMPIVMLSARSAEIDIVVGLDAGADDYVTKPFRVPELIARIQALLHRHWS